jgi:hypothetical protein
MAWRVLDLSNMKPEDPRRRDPKRADGNRISDVHDHRRVHEPDAGHKVGSSPRDAEPHVALPPRVIANAERRARRGRRSTRVSIDELIAKGQSVIDRVRPAVERTVGKLRARFTRK